MGEGHSLEEEGYLSDPKTKTATSLGWERYQRDRGPRQGLGNSMRQN